MPESLNPKPQLLNPNPNNPKPCRVGGRPSAKSTTTSLALAGRILSSGFACSRFRVQDLGLGFKVQGLGFRVRDLVSLGFRMLSFYQYHSYHWHGGSRHRVPYATPGMQNAPMCNCKLGNVGRESCDKSYSYIMF